MWDRNLFCSSMPIVRVGWRERERERERESEREREREREIVQLYRWLLF